MPRKQSATASAPSARNEAPYADILFALGIPCIVSGLHANLPAPPPTICPGEPLWQETLAYARAKYRTDVAEETPAWRASAMPAIWPSRMSTDAHFFAARPPAMPFRP